MLQIQEIRESLGLSLPPKYDTVLDMTLVVIENGLKNTMMRVDFLNNQKAVLHLCLFEEIPSSLWKVVGDKLALCEEILPPGMGFAFGLPGLGNAWCAVYSGGGYKPSPLSVEIRVEKRIIRHMFPKRWVRPVIQWRRADHRDSSVFGAAALPGQICIGYTCGSGPSELIVLGDPENLETTTVEVIKIPSLAEFCTGMSTVSSFGAEYLFLTTYDALIVLRLRGGILELARLY
ncbi:MAG: hypothetical protein EBT61_22220, partial [Verrucomicrobia bacterium]|nr:hypothetical protein [Verrucomicrobiota bacterium]